MWGLKYLCYMPKKDLSIKEPTNPTKLTPEQIEMAIEHVMDLKHRTLLHRKLGFKSRLAFERFCMNNPEFDHQLDQAKIAACKYLEDDALYVNDDFPSDSKAARVKLEAINKLLVWMKPERYSQKIDLNVNQTVSIRSNLEASSERVRTVIESGILTTPLLE